MTLNIHTLFDCLDELMQEDQLTLMYDENLEGRHPFTFEKLISGQCVLSRTKVNDVCLDIDCEQPRNP